MFACSVFFIVVCLFCILFVFFSYCCLLGVLNWWWWLLKPQSNGPLYSNTVIGTLAVDWWAITLGTAPRGLGGLRPRPVSSSLYQTLQPTHQRPVYQRHIMRCGTSGLNMSDFLQLFLIFLHFTKYCSDTLMCDGRYNESRAANLLPSPTVKEFLPNLCLRLWVACFWLSEVTVADRSECNRRENSPLWVG